MNNACMPIETIREGNKITKVCVEDFSKVIRKIERQIYELEHKTSAIFRSPYKDYRGVKGNFIIGIGTSQPCITDAFDKEIGNNIAFMKAKLNANLKKYKLLMRVRKEQLKLKKEIDKEIARLEEYIKLDIEGIRRHNPEYRIDKF